MDKIKTYQGWKFSGEDGRFILNNPQNTSYLYFPLANEAGIKSSISPLLYGDIKMDQNTFLMEPVSSESLHNLRGSRNFWLYIDGVGPWSATGNSARQIAENFSKENEKDNVKLEAGFLWHKLVRENKLAGVKSEIASFVPVNGDKSELMKIKITNIGDKTLNFVPTAAIPLYGRSADNIRDHRHVTSLLNKINTTKNGVKVKPTLSFDERGHRVNNTVYYVQGAEGDGTEPLGVFPIQENFVGEGGTLDWPESIVLNKDNYCSCNEEFEGFEAIGAIRFGEVSLKPGEYKDYIISMSILSDEEEFEKVKDKKISAEQFNNLLAENILYWTKKIESIKFNSGDKVFDQWMMWVTLQPILRRIYGCSFMPHHDYGRGGRGWRDLWQDCLALMVMEPNEVRNLLLNNYAGVRIDGSNATIIGTNPGEFIADRNNIARIWMDHGAWPFLTTKLYLDQSGDMKFLLEEQTYFKDKQINRCKAIDEKWNAEYGNKLKNTDREIYKGTILEHILVQQLTPFFNVGEHNNIKLEGADWNDAFDMADNRGESVAFTALYGSNLIELGKIIVNLKEKLSIERIEVGIGIVVLLDTLHENINYNSIEEKHQLLDKYFSLCAHEISGRKVSINVDDLANDLKTKGTWIIEHIRNNEWINNKDGLGWFNGYYDNNGRAVEGDFSLGVRMTLTGQVFAIMGDVATDEQIKEIVKSADKYLKDSKIGGYRLNTNFKEVKLDMGRCFGFAFGHKENGAVFSHMAIMYANALYKRGYVKEGYEVISSIYKHCVDFDKARIYPGIPEYINEKGRGMYHYLTGSASWLLLTVLNEIYGIKGCCGDLKLEPKLLDEQFDDEGKVNVSTIFCNKRLNITYVNNERKNYGEYSIDKIKFGEVELPGLEGCALISRTQLEKQSKDEIDIVVELK